MNHKTPVITRPSVFLSYTPSDRDLASGVSTALRRAGIAVTSVDELEPGGEYSEHVRQALHLSDAVVVVLSTVGRRREIPAGVLFEIGAAAGANKPIYVVVDEAATKLPFNISHLEVLPASRVGEIAQHLMRASEGNH